MAHIVMSCGMGVQSSTLLRLNDLDMVILDGVVQHAECAIFANTQQEPASVMKWIEKISPQIKTPIHVVSRGDLGADGLVVNRSKLSGKLYQKNLLPLFIKKVDGKRGILKRKCTSEYKIREIFKKCRQLYADEYKQWRKTFKVELKEFATAKKEKRACDSMMWKRMQDGALIESWIGISTDEAERMKPSREPWLRNRYPLIELGWSRQMCIDWYLEKFGERPPRSACKFCPYHSDNEWRRLKFDEPDEFAAAVQYERDLQAANKIDEVTLGIPFLHDSLVPLDQVEFGDRPDRFGDECGGVCGVDL